MKQFILYFLALLLCIACSKDDELPYVGPAQRTVIVYMSGENNLSSYIEQDLSEMKTGRKQVTASEQLVVFVDKANSNEKPYIAKITASGALEKLYEYDKDFLASDPEKMKDVLQRAITLCPATKDYGLVLWGHASGWIIEKDSVATSPSGARRAYGVDNGKNNSNHEGFWLNIPSMRQMLKELGTKWRFIFFDCCNMMNIETAYELKDAADYLIGSPAEIPGNGAPYDKVVPDLFLQTDKFYKSIIDDYAAAYPNRIPLAVIKTEKLTELAQATKDVLPQINSHVKIADMDQRIYYYSNPINNKRYRILYDMNEVVRKALADTPEAYQRWYSAFDQTVVVERIMAKDWATNSYININFSDFTMTQEDFGGVSMFFPQEKYQTVSTFNEDLKKMGWYYAVGWSDVGW